MTTAGNVEITMLPPAAAGDIRLMTAVSHLINEVYAVAEQGLWAGGTSRTTAGQVTELTRARQIATARASGELAGCVRIQQLGSRTGEFGMLAVAPAYRGMGAEAPWSGSPSSTAGTTAVTHATGGAGATPVVTPVQGSLRRYTRTGYQPARTGTIEEAYPGLAPLLATPCDFVIYRKNLTGRGFAGATGPR